jgi:DNA end-binding protein Ku
MPRSIWKGAIAFGLVHVPVALYPASQEDDIDFDWLDKRSMDPVGYQRINKRTGKTITKENIVKGVKQEDGTYVLVDDDEIRNAYPKTMQTIEIEAFVKAEEIPFVYLEKPYFLEPIAKADKVYALLREAMIAHDVIGIARVVMHTKEHLAALMPSGAALVLNTLRWATEVRDWEQLRIPAAGKAAANLKDTELKMAGQLIDELTVKWKADTYTDNFADAIHKLIAAKVQAGKTHEVTPLEAPVDNSAPSNVVDLTALLKSSLGKRRPTSDGADADAASAPAAPARKTAGKTAAKAIAPKAKPAAARKTAEPAAKAKAAAGPARKRA